MIPVLFKKDEQQFRTYGLGEITDIINPKITRERNGQYLLYFQYPQNAEFSDVFEEDMRIKSDAGVRTKWQTFEISRVIRKEGQLIEVFAKHISQSLLKDALNPNVNVRSSNAQQALRIWNNNRIGDEEFDVWSDISTTSSTSWDIRDVSNAFEALAGVQGSILDVWGGEYEFDNKMIRLHKEMGRKSPVPLEYGRNITGLEQDIQEDNVYTSIYPFASYTPEGKTEPKVVTLPEHYVDGKYLEMHNKRKIQVVDFGGEFEHEDVPTVSRLRALAKQYIKSNEVGIPHENLKVEYIDLSKTLDYQKFKIMEEVELNDRLPIFYPKFGITNENAKVVVINYDPVKEENISIELGVIGQSFRTVTTGGIGSRLDRVEKQQKETVNYIVNAKGNRIWFETPDKNMEHKIGDTWFEKNGPYDRIRVWNGNQWEVIIDTEDVDKIAKEVEQAQKEIADTKENIDNRLEDLDIELTGKFTDIDEELLTIEEISNKAEENAQIAISHGLDALEKAGQIEGDVSNISFEVDRIGGQLDLKADRAVVDEISEVVDMHELGIKANTDGLALKANKDTVDRLEGTVGSLGTEFDVIAGQVTNKVWKSDIESAVDGLSYENRNLFAKSKAELGYLTGVGESVISSHPKGEMTSEYIKIEGTEDLYLSYYFSPTPDYKWIAWTFYDENKENINGRPGRHIRDTEDSYDIWYRHLSVPEGAKYFRVSARWLENGECKLKLEKGTKATDYSLAPEDTDAKIDYIETEFNQTFEKFDQRVVNLDGQLSLQSQEIGRITQTIQDVSESVEGNTTKINQTINTVDSHGQTIATIETDLDGKVEVSEYNSLVSTVDSTIRRIGDAEGNITQIEASINGLQTTVAGKVSLTQFSQLETGFKLFASNINTVNKNLASRWVSQKITDDGTAIVTNTSRAIPMTKIPDNTTHLTVEDETWGGWYNSAFFWYKENSDSGYLGKYDLRINEDPGENIVTVEIPPNVKYFRYHTTPNMSIKTKIEVGTEATGLFYDDSEIRSEISVVQDNINLKVEKGDVVNQINISDENILIEANKIMALGDVVIDGKLTITDEFIASNAQIDGAKIADASINSAKIVSLDAGHIVTGEIRGINVFMKYGEIGDWQINQGMLSGQIGNRFTTIKATGDVAFGANSPERYSTTNATFQLWHSGRLRWLDNSGNTAGDIETSDGRLYYSGYSMELDRIQLPRHTFIGRDSNNEMSIQNAGSLVIYPGTSVYFRTGAVRPYANNYGHLGGANYRWVRVWTVDGVSESSDVRLKNKIVDIPLKLLNGISQVESRMYEMNGKIKFGYIAQDVERELFKYASQVVGARNASEYIKQFDVLDKNDESYQALMYSQIEVLKGAYRDKRIEENYGKIVHVEDEVAQLKTRINKLKELLNAN